MSEAERTLRKLLLDASKRAALGGVVAGTAVTAALTVSGINPQLAAGVRTPNAAHVALTSGGKTRISAPAAPTSCTNNPVPSLNPPSSINPPCTQAASPPVLGIGSKTP